MDEMCRDRSSMSDIAANEAIYLLLKDGYTYTATSDDEEDYVVRYIDWETADNNDFLLAVRCRFPERLKLDVQTY
ncbi:hypothetical protein MCT38_14410 [Vibrio aestuarianus]|nr:type I restriction endonuclease [Vibrio aestuarianus]MDE1286771.1 hypothetical protein [Vibrio aestuarianus]